MANVVVGAIVVAAVGAAIAYIVKEKKRGVTCIGCPHAGTCAKKRQGGCSSHDDRNDR